MGLTITRDSAGALVGARKRQSRRKDVLFRWFTASAAMLILALMAAFLLRLAISSQLSIHQFGWGFLVSREWNPYTGEFGALPSIFGTLVSTAIAMLLAVPLSLIIALFLVEVAPPVVAKAVGSAIELLAAIPSIIYGMWGMFVFAPFMAKHIQPKLQGWTEWTHLPLFSGPPMGIGMLTAGVILALMILPFISAVMRDVFEMVPPVVKESAYGVGATTWEVMRKITVRYGVRGLIGACFLGLGRAIGETMAVTFVIGNAHQVSTSIYSPGTSIASTLANEFAEASEPLYLSALVELGLILFVLSFLLQVLAHWWLGRVAKSMGAL